MINKKNNPKKYVELFPNEVVVNGSDKLYCICCQTVVSSDKKDNVNSHRNSKKHKLKVEKNSYGTQTFLNSNTTQELIVSTFLETDIPLYKLRSNSIKNLFSKLNISCPSETHSKKNINENG